MTLKLTNDEIQELTEVIINCIDASPLNYFTNASILRPHLQKAIKDYLEEQDVGLKGKSFYLKDCKNKISPCKLCKLYPKVIEPTVMQDNIMLDYSWRPSIQMYGIICENMHITTYTGLHKCLDYAIKVWNKLND